MPVVTIDDKIDELISFYQDYLKQGGKMDFMTFAKKSIENRELSKLIFTKSIDEILWRYQTDQTNNLYLCAQTQKIILTEQDIEDSYYA